MNLLEWLSTTAPAVWARESESLWAYPTILFLHTFGLAVLVGFAAAIDFRVLGFSPKLPLAPMGRFFRYVWIGFWINALSGGWLLIMTPAKVANPAFIVKMTCIGLAVVALLWLKREVFPARAETSGFYPTAPTHLTNPPPVEVASALGKALAAVSLLLWTGAIVAGRLMAYLGNTR